MKKVILALACVAMLFATSCKKENVNPAVDAPEGSFIATIDNNLVQNAPAVNDGIGTMTHLDGRSIAWTNNDKITVNGIEYTTSADATSAVFNISDQSNIGVVNSPFHAFYPESIQQGDGAMGSLSATQTYTNGSTLLSNIPLYAYSTNNTLTFGNIFAVLHFTMPCDVESIEVSSEKAMNGAFTVTNGIAVMGSATDDNNKTTVTPNGGGKFTAGNEVFVAVPANVEYQNITFKLKESSNVVHEYTKQGVTLAINKLYNVTFTPVTPPTDGFHFTAAADNVSITFNKKNNYAPNCTLEYYKPGFLKWLPYTMGTPITLANTGDKVYFRAQSEQNRLASSTTLYHYFSSTGNVKVGGNICYLLSPEGNNNISKGSAYTYAYTRLFYQMTTLTDASELILPSVAGTSAYGLPENCFESMFEGCTGLTTVFSSLPSENINKLQYYKMFKGCTALTNTPSIGGLATVYNETACQEMFYGCTSLQTASTIKINNSTPINQSSIFYNMFAGCTALTTVNVELSSGATVDNNSHGALLFWNWLPNNNGTINVSGGATAADFTDYTNKKVAYYMNQKSVKVSSTYNITPANWTIILNGNTTITRP